MGNNDPGKIKVAIIGAGSINREFIRSLITSASKEIIIYDEKESDISTMLGGSVDPSSEKDVFTSIFLKDPRYGIFSQSEIDDLRDRIAKGKNYYRVIKYYRFRTRKRNSKIARLY